jgi:hypothetical protein
MPLGESTRRRFEAVENEHRGDFLGPQPRADSREPARRFQFGDGVGGIGEPVATLVRYTRLSERSVQNALRALEELGLIEPSDPQIVAAYVKRADRRPNGWDLVIHNVIHSSVHSLAGGVQTLHPVGSNVVQTRRDGVQATTSRGADSAPETSLNHPGNRPPRERATTPPAAAPAVAGSGVAGSGPGGGGGGWLPVCGQCDGRPTDPVTARVVWLDAARENSEPCPRCHPAVAVAVAGGNGR